MQVRISDMAESSDASTTPLNNPDPLTAKSIHEFNVLDDKGEVVQLSKYADQVILIVNVASYWGSTDANYTQLQQLHESLAEKGKFCHTECKKHPNAFLAVA